MKNQRNDCFKLLFVCLLMSVGLPMCGGGGGGGAIETQSQTRTVSGRVIAPYQTDSSLHVSRESSRYDNLDLNGIPLGNARITISGTDLSASTDSQGYFSISSVSADTSQVITAEKNGLIFNKRIPGGTGDIYVNINYQTTTAYHYYSQIMTSIPSYITIDWLEKAIFIQPSLDLYKAASRYRSIAQDYVSGASRIPPHEDAQFNSLVSNTSDKMPPYISSIGISPENAVSGDEVTLTISAYDPSGVKSASVHYMRKRSNIAYWNSSIPSAYVDEILFDEITSISGADGVYTITMKTTIGQAFPAGEYMLGVLRITDNNDIYSYYTGVSGNRDTSSYLSSNTITVTPVIVDTAPPELLSTSISQQVFDDTSDTLTLTVALKDDASSIEDAFFVVYDGHGVVHYPSCVLSSTGADYSYECKVVFTKSHLNSYSNGTCRIYQIDVRDKSGNRTRINIDNLEFEINLTKSETSAQDRSALSAVTLSLDSNSSIVEARFSVNAPQTSNVYILIGLGRESSNGATTLPYTTRSISTAFNPALNKWEHTSQFKYFNDFFPFNELSVSSLRFEVDSNLVFYCGNIEDCKSLDIQRITESNPNADTTAPNVISVLGIPQNVNRLQPFTVIITAEDSSSGIKEARLFFYNQSSTDSLSYILIEANQFTHVGNGIWQASIPISFPEYTTMGTLWQLTSLRITDFAGNFIYLNSSSLTDLMGSPAQFTIQ